MTTSIETRSGGTVAGWLAAAETRARQQGEPAWALARRAEAAAAATSLAFPGRESDLWRRIDLAALDLGPLDPARGGGRARGLDDLPVPVLERLAAEQGALGLVVQRGADIAHEQTHPALERQGVIVCSLDRALAEHADKVRPHWGAQLAAGEDRWTAMAEAVRRGGAFVHVPDGVQAALPIRLVQWIDAAGTYMAPHHVIVLGRGARATIIEEQLSEPGEQPSLYGGGTEVVVGEGAHLTFGTLQDWARNVYHYTNTRVRVERDAELQWIQTMIGGRVMKSNVYFDLAGPGAQAFVHGFMFGDQRQQFHLHTLQRHRLDHTTSDLLIKSCLKDRARSVYQGLIQVSEGAQRTDAYQANRNLLLSKTARADSIPGLEILANDVRCTHGATIGHVDQDQMFYLMARGLPERDAQRLIVEGFFTPVLDRIPLESVRAQLRAAIEHKIG